ncbi:dehydratase [Rhodobacteraceae bacterium NNCM2]|nr:dehydratase [Coraliihabitans acroporae]
MTGMYFEEFQTGQTFKSAGRTITEADLTMFSMISGDWHPIHADIEFSKNTHFGERVVHGAFGIAVATGMMHEVGIFKDTAVAMLSLREWSFAKPILVNDTLHLEMEITKLDGARSERMGSVDRILRLVNQKSEVVQEGMTAVLVLKTPRSGTG